MTEDLVDLDERRGLAAQKSIEIRRFLHEVQADRAALRASEEELEALLIDAPVAGWADVAVMAQYLLQLFAATPEAQNPRRKALIARVHDDLTRLRDDPKAPS